MNGLLIINKPKGITSHKVTQKIKTLFKIKKIGHCGTLDPSASGILLICMGNITKHAKYLSTTNKRYIVKGVIGLNSFTHDTTGINMFFKQSLCPNINKNIYTHIITKKTTQNQTTPIFSATKYKGLPLYKYARINLNTEKIFKKIILYKSSILILTKKTLILDITCSKGTYIRTILNNIGKKINIPICAYDIHRITSGPYNILHSHKLINILHTNKNLLKSKLISI